MDILDKLDLIKPSTWTNIEIPEGDNYASITLKKDSQEYLNVKNILINYGQNTDYIKKIKRIQHPCAYGSFLLREKQLKEKGCDDITPKSIVINLNEKELTDALWYNLDQRRITIHSHKKKYDCQIIAKCLRSCLNSIQMDSEVYPEYVVYYKRFYNHGYYDYDYYEYDADEDYSDDDSDDYYLDYDSDDYYSDDFYLDYDSDDDSDDYYLYDSDDEYYSDDDYDYYS